MNIHHGIVGSTEVMCFLETKIEIKNVFTCVLVFLVASCTVMFWAGTAFSNPLYSPEEYEGKTIVIENAKMDGRILEDRHINVYCIYVEINGTYIPGYLYRSQLNFIVASSELARRLITNFNHNVKSEKRSFEGVDHLIHDRTRVVKLTATIQNIRGYWVAVVSKIEVYGKNGKIIDIYESSSTLDHNQKQ